MTGCAGGEATVPHAPEGFLAEGENPQPSLALGFASAMLGREKGKFSGISASADSQPASPPPDLTSAASIRSDSANFF